MWERDGEKIKLVSSWPTDIGQKDGDKLVEGDKRTPEGVYFFQTAMDGKRVNYNEYGNRIFTLDYPNYFDRLEKKSEEEEGMLDAVCDQQPNSRLSCQIKVTDEIEGLIVGVFVEIEGFEGIVCGSRLRNITAAHRIAP